MAKKPAAGSYRQASMNDSKGIGPEVPIRSSSRARSVIAGSLQTAASHGKPECLHSRRPGDVLQDGAIRPLAIAEQRVEHEPDVERRASRL